MAELTLIENQILEAVRQQGPMDILVLADRVARQSRAPLRVIDRAVRLLLQKQLLRQDRTLKVYVADNGDSGAARDHRAAVTA